MALSINGNNLVFTGTLTVTNFTNPTNGVATLVLTPNGGVGTLPALLAGQPGQAPLFTLGTVTTLSAGAAATVTLNQTSAGGAGVSSAYTISFGIPQGVAGSSVTTISTATDLTGTAVVNDFLTVSQLSPTKFQYSVFPFGVAINPSSISTVSTSGPATGTLCTVSIPAQSYRYVPLVFASCTSVGTANTVINLNAILNPSGVNQTIGTDFGLASTPTQKLKIGAAGFASLIGSGGAPGFGEVAAGVTASVAIQVQQTASVTDAWSVSNSTVGVTVVALPVAFT